MRLPTILFAAMMFALVGCASTTGIDRAESYSSELDQLSADCEERGGILATTGQQTGRPQTDNVCKTTGGPSDRLRSATGG